MSIAIRPAALNDVPAIVAIEQQAPTASHWTPQQYHDLICGGVVLVAEQAGQLCGFICAKAVAGEWEIENLVTAPALLRRGIAGHLLLALLERAQCDAASSILLEVRESNLPARRLYEKRAFRETGRRRLYYKNPEEDAVLYALRLAP